MIIRLVIFLAFVFFIETYAYQAVKTLTNSKHVLYLHVFLSLALWSFIAYSFLYFDRSQGQTKWSMLGLGIILVAFLPKLFLTTILFMEDVFRLSSAIFSKLTGNSSASFLPNRRKFVSQIAFAIASVPFTSLLYGMFYGKYNYKVIRQQLVFEDLPAAFDGFTITQISDVHSGSFDDAEKIKYAIDLINEQKSDILLFTGDIVNTHAKEMFPWIEIFNQIEKPKFGKFAVLGNHDYGEYVDWKSPKEKNDNFEAIKKLYGQIGFDLLLNENKYIHKENQKIALVGVENWGVKFKKVGDLNKATQNLSNEEFKILMSHDPSHWDAQVVSHPKKFHLTLSGHTHGLQFGIEIPGFFRWSPAQYIYKQWAGLYQKAEQYIYVNRGFGFHAYPGRVGIMPEITVIELKKQAKVAS